MQEKDLFSTISEHKADTVPAGGVFSVSQYLDRVNGSLKSQKSKIVGEVCDVKMYEGRSYLYFSIKDKADNSTANCFMWKRDFKLSGVELRDGLEVIITAYPQVYKPNGSLSLQVELVELVGEGALQVAYEQLKKKMEAEGLFNPVRKRALPEYPQRIGVITSKSGAVIHDFLSNLGKFGFEILFTDSKVEGQDAIRDLLAAVKTLRTADIDVLVMMRGGGSLESFQAFNNEILVRAIADFPVPVITGIGHDKDVPLVSLVSDKNVSTPTAVTHLLNQSWNEARSHVRLAEQKMFFEFETRVREARFEIEQSQSEIEEKFSTLFDIFRKAEATISHAVVRIESAISQKKREVIGVGEQIFRTYSEKLHRISERVSQYEKTFELADPARLLARGYSIIKTSSKSGGKVIRSTAQVHSGDELDIMLCDGIIETKVI